MALATLVVESCAGHLERMRGKGPRLRRPRPCWRACRQDQRRGRNGRDRHQARTSSGRHGQGDVTIDKDNTTIIGGGAQKAIEGHVEQLRSQIPRPLRTTTARSCRKVRRSWPAAWRRPAWARPPRPKLKEEKASGRRHARHRAAVEEGIVPGGGVALFGASEALKILKMDGDEQIGVNIVRRACGGQAAAPDRGQLRRPRRLWSARFAKTKTRTSATTRPPIPTRTWCHRPTKVTRTALQTRPKSSPYASTTEAMIADVAKDRRRRPAPWRRDGLLEDRFPFGGLISQHFPNLGKRRFFCFLGAGISSVMF